MPAWDVYNESFKKQNLHQYFPPSTPDTFIHAQAAVASLPKIGVTAAGAVGCLDRGVRIVFGFSAAIGKQMDWTKMKGGLARILKRTYANRFWCHKDIIVAAFLQLNVKPCAEKYLFSYVDDGPILGMTVLWYGGAKDAPVPEGYDSIAGDGFTFMLPCADCIRVSTQMVQHCRKTKPKS